MAVRSSFLERLAAPDREALASKLQQRKYPAGQVVFNDGDRGDSMFIVDSGRLEVQMTTHDGQTVTVRVVQPGELFGELALVHPDDRRTGRVRALEATTLRVLTRRDFEAVRRDHPALDRFLVEVLAERVRRTSEIALESALPAETRVWRRLAAFAEAYAGEPIHMSQESLAQAAGTVRQTANRVVREAVRDGIVTVGRGSITVLDGLALRRRAGLTT